MDSAPGVTPNVSPSDKFDSQRPAFALSQAHVALDILPGRFKVCLNCCHHEDLAVAVILPHKVNRPVVDCWMIDLLLCVDPDTLTLCFCLVTDIFQSLPHPERGPLAL